MAYTATNNLNDLVETSPPASGFVNTDLGPAALETRRTFKAVILKEHNPDGTHASVNGAVIVAGSIPGTALAAGAVPVGAIADGTITGAKLANETVTSAQIADTTITGTQVALKTLPAGVMKSITPGNIWVADGAGGMTELTMSGAVTINSTGVTALTAASVKQAIAIFADIETTGTDGGTFTTGAWQVRKLNSTVIDSAALFNLAANVLTLATAGTYYIKAYAVAYKVDAHQIRLWDPTNSVVLAVGTPAIAAAASSGQSTSELECVITLAPSISQTLEIQHQCGTTEASDGFGKNSGFGNCIFTQITIIKLA